MKPRVIGALLLLAVPTLVSGQSETRVQVYFDNPAMELAAQNRADSTAIPVAVFPVARTVPSKDVEKKTVSQLLKGPTSRESASGYETNLSNLRLERFSIRKGTATVGLRGKLLLKGTLSGLRLRTQIERTLRQFRSVRRIALTINGRKDFDSLK
ncbi:MAG: GerMN domain-containing protein [Bacteroidota bacterium]